MENVSKITYSLVALVVMVLLIVTVALPVIDSQRQATEVVYNNDDLYYSSLVDGSHTLVYATNVLTIDGETVDNTYGISRPLLFCDSGMLTLVTNNTQCNLYMFGQDSIAVGYIKAITLSIDATLKTITLDSITVSQGTAPEVGTVFEYDNFCFLADNDGDYAIVDASVDSKTLYVTGKDSMYVFAGTPWAATKKFAVMHGSYVKTSEATTPSLAATLVPVSGIDGVFTVSAGKTAGDVAVELGDSTVNASVIVPKTITIEMPTHGVFNSLLGILPLILVCVPLVTIVRMFMSRGD